jgi:aspartyl-tRNA(Asn)/glutamyl-tRNA(Gln) amidotransferase subunit A
LSAVDAAKLIRRKKLSPVAYVDAILAAIERSQPVLNAFVIVTADMARTEAKAAEAAVMRGDELGPLHGVPVSIKDMVDTKGVRCASGSVTMMDYVPAADATVVIRLRSAGAIVTGKTTTPEFGHKGLTDSPMFGITRNPWNLNHTPGGSSGGAAAATAAGLGPIALGTDGAGSIRLPASASGIVGHKPTRGAVPHGYSPEVFGNFSYAGPMARSVADAVAMFEVLAGPDDTDPWSLAGGLKPMSPSIAVGDLSGVRVGYVRRMANPDVDVEVQAATEAATRALADLGAEVDEVTDAVDWIEEAGRILMRSAMFARSERDLATHGNRMDASYKDFIEDGRKVSMVQLRQANEARTRLFKSVQALFRRYDFLVTPTLVTTALPVTHHASRDQVVVNGKPAGFTRTGWTSYLYPFNLAGHPAISVPNGWSKAGLPIGFQIVGPWWSDRDCFGLAACLERARPWAHKRPPHWGGATS